MEINNNDYTYFGKCIWCLRTDNETSFIEKPHTISKSLGGRNIGFDVCDDCNHYFGEPDESSFPRLTIEVCVKEVFNVSKLLFSKRDKNSWKNFKSLYFEYRHKKNTIIIKRDFRRNSLFSKTFTRQFKRGLYEYFLQEYHRVTKKGLSPEFDEVRSYARYGEGDLPVYYVTRRVGVYLLPKNFNHVEFYFSDETLKDIEKYGFYNLYILGHNLYLEVTPRAREFRRYYLQEEINRISSGIFESIIEVKDINDIDFLLRKLFGEK